MTPSQPPRTLLRPIDALALAFLAGLALLAACAWSRGIPRSAGAVLSLLLGGALLLALRVGALLVPSRMTAFLAANAPIAMVPIDWSLDPIVDLVHPGLIDGRLLAADRWLFGETPSILAEKLLHPWLTEALLLGYLSYFAILVIPLVLLFWLRGEEVHDGYCRALGLLFILNLGFYVVAPAVGPRFQVAHLYAAPLHGVLFGDTIRDLFLNVPFFRDCFPSGHTAGTVLALVYTRKRLPRFFWAALPVGGLCIAATVLCRFHYAIDVLCALPLCWCAVQASKFLKADSWPTFARLRAAVD